MDNRKKIYKIPKELKTVSSIIYFLYKNKELVYIGETKRGIIRIMSHIETKEFDSYSFETFNGSDIDRKIKENILIAKYKPKYNRSIIFFNERLKLLNNGFINVEKLRVIIRNKYGRHSYKYTHHLIKNIKRYCDHKILGSSLYVKIDDIINIININI